MSKIEYKYVTKKETKQYKERFNLVFKKLQEHFNDDFSLAYKLVGSSKRNLVIRRDDKGFDLDYQIFITKIKAKKKLTDQEIKEKFFNFFQKIKEDLLNKCEAENSTSAITLKNKKITGVSYDVAIFRKNTDRDWVLLKRDTNENKVVALKQAEYKKFKKNYEEIKKEKLWVQLRDEYYEKYYCYKILKKDESKKSYLILIEAVENVLRKYNKKTVENK